LIGIEEDAVTVQFESGSRATKYFGVKINTGPQIMEIENCQLIHAYVDIGLYVFKTRSSNAKVKFVTS